MIGPKYEEAVTALQEEVRLIQEKVFYDIHKFFIHITVSSYFQVDEEERNLNDLIKAANKTMGIE